MEYAIVGEYKSKPVYLMKDGTWFIAFGSLSHRYELNAINKILSEKPDYEFETQDKLNIRVSELKDLLEQINKMVPTL